MVLFNGQTTHTLDPKGRLVLPASYREFFVLGGHLTPDPVGCVSLWTPTEYNLIVADLTEKAKTSSAGRAAQRHWAAHSSTVEFDKMGRFAVPARLRTASSLEGEVLIIGNLNHIELWNPDAWARYDEVAAGLFAEDIL
jgi:MraZ protein